MPDEQANADEGASTDKDLKAQNSGETTVADQTSPDDPKKAEKLTQAGRAIDPDEGSD